MKHENKNLKKITAVSVLALLSASVMCSCGGTISGAPDSTPNNTGSQTAETKANTTTETETEMTETTAATETTSEITDDDSDLDVEITQEARYECYSAKENNYEYFFTFDVVIPHFEYRNPAHQEKQDKLNRYFMQIQEDLAEEMIMPGYVRVERADIEAIVLQDAMKDQFYTSNFNVTQADKQYCSICFSDYAYSGGAHGGGATSGAFVDLTTGDVLDISELVTSFDEFGDFLAAYFYDHYSEQYGQLMFWNQENLITYTKRELQSSWYLEENQFVVDFPAYTFGSFADGNQVVKVPLEECKSFFNDRGKALIWNE